MTLKQSNNNGHNINVGKVEGNLIIGARAEVQQLLNDTTEKITAEQAKTINSLADSFAQSELEIDSKTENHAAILKSIAYKAAGVAKVKDIPSCKYTDALQAMRLYIHKQTKPI
jgi:hypothetical protein